MSCGRLVAVEVANAVSASRNADHTITGLRPIRSASIPAKGAPSATPRLGTVTVRLTASSLAWKICFSSGSSGCVA